MNSRKPDRNCFRTRDDNSYTYYVHGAKKPKIDIAEVIEDLKTIESEIEKGNSDYKEIKALHLIDCQLDDKDITQLVEYLNNNNSITSLKLNHNLITDEGVKSLVDLLSKNDSIKHFEIPFNLHTKVGIEYLVEKLIKNESNQNEFKSGYIPRDMILTPKQGFHGIQWSTETTFSRIMDTLKFLLKRPTVSFTLNESSVTKIEEELSGTSTLRLK